MGSKSQINPKAVYIGLGVFAVLYLVFVLAVNIAVNVFDLKKFGGVLFWGQIALFVLSGYVAGYLSGSNGWLNGIMVGIPAPVIIGIGVAIATQQVSALLAMVRTPGVFWLILSVVLCAVGGLIADLTRKGDRTR